MRIGVMVTEGPYQHQASDSAYHFVKAALARGHDVTGVFFYMDGVYNANGNIKPPGERSISLMWQEIAAQGVDLVFCMACSKFRGLDTNNVAEWVRGSGLGQLDRIIGNSDRFITFRD